jgi:catechol 2,3-dioxygenase-like lactoylglutathione lyase family enzyme
MASKGAPVARVKFMMLSDADAVATIAVKDLKVAKKFYEETLGLKPFDEQNPGGARYHSGKSTLFVYESQYAGTNQATSATWVVDDAEEVVRALKAKGVSFEHYDLPGLTRQGDLHVAGSFKGAWFKDPDGNILHVLSV